MECELIIVRYGEIALKGKETRNYFENYLVNNINNAFKKEKVKSKIKKEWGRIYIYTKQIKESIIILEKIFGIYSFSPSFETKGDMDSISKLSLFVSKQFLKKEKTFAIRTTRTGKHDFSSQDVSVRIGNDIVQLMHAKVDLTNPNFELFIEIRDDKAFIFIEKICGTGGMPLGTQGKILALINNYNSILASWYLMKRGCKAIFLITDDIDVNKLRKFTDNWHEKLDFYHLNSDEKNFYEKLCKIAEEKKCDAIVTGHCLCINSAEEISKIKKLSQNINLPVFHPLISMNKNEIDVKCKDIGLEL